MVREPLQGKSVLVTGGAGFIGSHLVDRLVKAGASSVSVLDNMFLGSEENLSSAYPHGVTLYKDDAEFPEVLEYIVSEREIEVVFNCATKALNYSFVNPKNSFETNVAVTLNLLELLRKRKFNTLCHFSSSEVYGTAVYEPMDEHHPRNPTTTYAAGKAAADLAVESYVRMFGLDAFVVRPFNNYGPRQNYRGKLAGVIPKTVSSIADGLAPTIHGDGSQKRDFIYVIDTVEFVLDIFGKVSKGETVNVTTDNSLEIGHVIDMIISQMGYNGRISREPARSADVYCHRGSNAKLQRLSRIPVTPFSAGLRETIEWQLADMKLK